MTERTQEKVWNLVKKIIRVDKDNIYEGPEWDEICRLAGEVITGPTIKEKPLTKTEEAMIRRVAKRLEEEAADDL